MRFNTAIYIVTSLLAFASAADSKDATIKGVDFGSDTCKAQSCDAGLPACLEQCGPGPHCDGYCACILHSDPNSTCRQLGCVEAPPNCDKWMFDERDTAQSGPGTAESDGIAMDDQESPPIDHCQVCRAAVWTCQQNCRGEKACEGACDCPVTEKDSCHKCASTHCSSTIQSASSDDVDHCQDCRVAVATCQQNCKDDQTCLTSCLCPNSEGDSCGKCQFTNCPSAQK